MFGQGLCFADCWFAARLQFSKTFSFLCPHKTPQKLATLWMWFVISISKLCRRPSSFDCVWIKLIVHRLHEHRKCENMEH